MSQDISKIKEMELLVGLFLILLYVNLRVSEARIGGIIVEED